MWKIMGGEMNINNLIKNHGYVHIVVGDSAYAYVKEYFKKNKENKYYGKIINFREDLSVGSIFMLDENIDIRYKWFKKMYLTHSRIDEKALESLKEDIFNTYKIRLNLPKESKIVIWHGKNTSEQVALSYLVNRYKENKIFEVNIAKFFNNEDSNNDYEIKAVAQCDLDELNMAINSLSLIDETRVDKLIKTWNCITADQGTLRILKDDHILSVDESYYDDLIMESTTDEYIKAARVVGRVMGMSDQLVSDTFLLYRISRLIDKELIEYKGDLWHLGTLYIKRKLYEE